jgi:hypothetical protein
MVFARTLTAEWTKLRTVRGPWWTAVVAAGSMVAFTAFIAAVAHTDATRAGQGDDDVVVNALRGVFVGQLAIVSFGVLAITSEYGTGLIRATFAASPVRGGVFAAKATTVAVTAAVAGTVASVASFQVAQPLLHGGGFVPPAYPIVALSQPDVLRAVLGTALFLTALALFAFGVGVIVRHTGGAATAAIGAVLLPTVLAEFFPGRVRDLVLELTPSAGLAIQSTRPGAQTPFGPWGGLAVTAIWALASLTVASVLLRVRDV